MDRFLVPSHGPDEQQLRVAIFASTECAKEHGTTVTIVVPALNHVEGTILTRILGERYVRNLRKGKKSTLSGVPVKLCSKRTLNPYIESGVVLLLWGNEKSLNSIEKAKAAKALIVLPWIEKDSSLWASRFCPIILEVNDA